MASKRFIHPASRCQFPGRSRVIWPRPRSPSTPPRDRYHSRSVSTGCGSCRRQPHGLGAIWRSPPTTSDNTVSKMASSVTYGSSSRSCQMCGCSARSAARYARTQAVRVVVLQVRVQREESGFGPGPVHGEVADRPACGRRAERSRRHDRPAGASPQSGTVRQQVRAQVVTADQALGGHAGRTSGARTGSIAAPMRRSSSPAGGPSDLSAYCPARQALASPADYSPFVVNRD